MEEYRTIVMGAGAAIALIVVVAIVVTVIRRRRRARALQAPLPLIPFSSGRVGPSRPDGALRASTPSYFDRVNAPTPEWSPSAPDSAPASSFAPPAPRPGRGAGRAEQAAYGPSANPLAATAMPADLVSGAAVDGASVRYWRPADGTLQFLPGRLEVIAGRDAGQEIRFVRTPGPEGTEVTFGRAEGEPYRHVQLREPTVSRAHARMTLELTANGADAAGSVGRWRLENLSATNPVVVNGRPLGGAERGDCSVVLAEGDRIEMGEVVFRFHAR